MGVLGVVWGGFPADPHVRLLASLPAFRLFCTGNAVALCGARLQQTGDEARPPRILGSNRSGPARGPGVLVLASAMRRRGGPR